MNAAQDSRRLRPEVAKALEALLARPYRWGAPVEVGVLGDLAERDRLLAVAECIRIVETRAGDARSSHAQALHHALMGTVHQRNVDLEGLCEVLTAIGSTRHVCGYAWPHAWKLAQALIKRGDLGPDLYAALRAMQPAMNDHGSDKHARIAIDRELFFERHLPLDVAQCAGAILKASLRAMPDDQRRRWQGLLHHGMSGQHAEPKPTWMRKLEGLTNAVGADVLVQTRAWISEAARLETVTLSAAGADALRAVVWITIELGDSSAGEDLARLAEQPHARGRAHWSPRHDRFVGSLAWALGRVGHPRTSEILDALEKRFGRTTAKYAITNAKSVVPRPFRAAPA
ncbi:MAG: hypothetical protein J0L92_30905 [Deltaproteobacteria bacterium]|nr:hypothetical protein [Deltaproteobacteria bacterium]